MEELTLNEMQDRMAAGELTARHLTETYLARIREIDQAGPRLNSVIEINPDALEIAAALDQEREKGTTRGPLHGIPLLLKDNIATADRMQTTAGSLALVGSRVAQDATSAARLRAAGAIILGKTNLSEWANFRSSHSVSGWSSRGGQTRNPYALDRTPCGSSSGSAVAVAANLCAAAVGTETRWVHHLPVANLRHRGHQADPGPGEPGRHRSDCTQPGHRGPDGAHGRRCSPSAGRTGGP